MGKVDEITKQYMQDAGHFADLFNYIIFDGEQVIKPQNVSDVDPVLIESLYDDTDSDEKKIDELIQRYRDVIKYEGSGLRSLDRETTILLNKLIGSNIPTPEGKETIGMERVSKAIMEIRQEGEEEGKILGAVEALRDFNIPDSQIAENIIKSYNLTPEQANIYLADTKTEYGKAKQ